VRWVRRRPSLARALCVTGPARHRLDLIFAESSAGPSLGKHCQVKRLARERSWVG
jgi:hypothetical protein